MWRTKTIKSASVCGVLLLIFDLCGLPPPQFHLPAHGCLAWYHSSQTTHTQTHHEYTFLHTAASISPSFTLSYWSVHVLISCPSTPVTACTSFNFSWECKCTHTLFSQGYAHLLLSHTQTPCSLAPILAFSCPFFLPPNGSAFFFWVHLPSGLVCLLCPLPI